MQLLVLLSKIPDVVWSGLLASVITLSGVMLSNWSNTKRLVKQLSHDSDEKEKDRISALRRDVYLKAVEEMAKVGGYLGKIPQLDPAKTNIADGLTDFLAVSAKLQLIAHPETSSLAGELTTRYGEILMSLLGKAMPVHDLNTEIRISGVFYDRNQAEVNRTLAEMTQLNESGEPNPVRFAALQRSFEASQALANKFAEKRQEAFEQHASAAHEYTVALMREMRTVGSLQVQLTAAIRNELNLTTDLAEYEARLQKNWERMDQSINDLLAKMAEG